MKNKRGRLPAFLPKWIKDRVEVNTYKLVRFMKWAGGQVGPGDLLLDAGAGEGRFKSIFSHTRYVGVDLGVGDSGWDYSALDAIAALSHLPFPESTFDAAICTQVLEHVTQPIVVLQEIARTLRPGGRLYLSAPQSWHQHQKPHDFYRYTEYGLRHLVECSGLTLESIDHQGGYFWFLSFQIQNFNYWVFSHRRRHWVTLPLRAFFGLLFQLILPLILFYLDGLDPIKDETFGHLCVAIKPGAQPG